MNLVNERNTLIEAIRKQKGFEYFLLPKPYNILCRAAQDGPVILLNSHEEGCDGIIILNSTAEPVHVSFPDVTVELLRAQRTTLKNIHEHRIRGESSPTRLPAKREDWISTEEQMKNMLNWLWNCVVGPIYNVLASHGIHSGRLWWLPTGAFAALPLHACAPIEQFINSYTATLSSLVEAYSKKPSKSAVKLGVVGVTHTGPGREQWLPGVKEEVDNICAAVAQADCLQDKQATAEAVKLQLENCSWVHLACHGTQDAAKPTRSRLLLYGENLELDTILRMPLSNAEVVFLAACQTAMGDSYLVNESMHLVGGLIAAGFRAAIGTLWSMNDEDGPLVAKFFYSHLFRDGRQPQASDTAEALDLAVRELKKNVSYERWVPFIHMGI
ncbi:hypothetical protein MVEN_02303300 [Mycena venus]|uniref:CHAT domain-containing protein n=1 Tax=Mycena venus TaxID=2733690 RepID=A0A8H6X654_9AGAR|nr:hypothetical protein MVEN_02303300 [Mycena venus]